jgi:hypothetical protein
MKLFIIYENKATPHKSITTVNKYSKFICGVISPYPTVDKVVKIK